MKINSTKDAGKVTVALEGRLDTITAPDLEKELKILNEGAEEVIFDFADLEYISSAGLRVLLSEQKSLQPSGGKMIVKNVNEVIMEVFEITGFVEVLTII